MTTVDEFLAELQKAGLADKTLSELKAKKLHELEKEVERLRAENAELRELLRDIAYLMERFPHTHEIPWNPIRGRLEQANPKPGAGT